MSRALYNTMRRARSPTFPSLHLRHSSFSKPSVALPTSQLILQLFRCFTYVKAHSPTLLSLLLRHRLFSYVTWRAPMHICSSFLSIVKSHPLKIPASVLEKVRAGRCLKLFLIDCNRFKYLGSLITDDNMTSEEIKRRIKKM